MLKQQTNEERATIGEMLIKKALIAAVAIPVAAVVIIGVSAISGWIFGREAFDFSEAVIRAIWFVCGGF